MTYRMCCISVGNSPSYKAATLFDTGAHASFVNREVASWIDEHGRTDRQVSNRMRGWHEASGTTVSLAGTSMSSPILGSVVFDLTFLNEGKNHGWVKENPVGCNCSNNRSDKTPVWYGHTIRGLRTSSVAQG